MAEAAGRAVAAATGANTGAKETTPLTKQGSFSSSHYDLEYNPNLNEKQIISDFILKVYSLLTLQLSITVAIGCWMCFSSTGIGFAVFLNQGVGRIFFYILSIVLIISMFCYKDRYPANLVIFSLLTLIEGSFVGSFCTYVSHIEGLQTVGRLGITEGAELVLLAFGLTAVIFITLTIYVVWSKQDFSFLGGFLFVCLISNLVLSFVGLLLGLAFFRLLTCVFGVLIFTGYILYDTDQIVNKVQLYDVDLGTALLGALELYLDVINLFIYILRLLLILAGDR